MKIASEPYFLYGERGYLRSNDAIRHSYSLQLDELNDE